MLANQEVYFYDVIKMVVFTCNLTFAVSIGIVTSSANEAPTPADIIFLNKFLALASGSEI